MNKKNQIIRHGAYAVVLSDTKILLTQKNSGPYKGLWGLPGGTIEFGETPEATVKRELLEESALDVDHLEFLYIATATGEYKKENNEPYEFHQIGLIYKTLNWTKRSDLNTQEENRWINLDDINEKELTPFAKDAISKLSRHASWRPDQRIRGKVIGLAEHESQILVCEVLNDEGILKGWCPLGGGIEFGETAEEALKREIHEELGCTIQITSKPIICENLFDHQGVKGHEIIFAFQILLDNPDLYKAKRFQIFEHRGSSHWVQWIDIEDFRSRKRILFPPKILDYL